MWLLVIIIIQTIYDNQFLRIEEEELGDNAVYAGQNLRFPCDPVVIS